MDGTRARAPLLFFPVVIKLESNNWAIHLRKDADVTFNKSFLLAYSFYNQVRVEDFLLDETFEERDTDSTVFRTALYQLLQKSSVDIHFNPDNYRDELDFFKPFTQPEFDDTYANGSFKLFPEAVLGIFPQAGSYLVPDYVELIEGGHVGSLEGFFMGKTRQNNSRCYSPTSSNW